MDLIDAVIANDTENVKRLLEEGANPNQCDEGTSISPLHFAAQNNSLEVASLLVAAGADLNATDDEDGDTPLAIAKLHQNQEMFALLTKLAGKLH